MLSNQQGSTNYSPLTIFNGHFLKNSNILIMYSLRTLKAENRVTDKEAGKDGEQNQQEDRSQL